MENPQTENGYTRIANELMEALAGIRINGEARQCLDVIIRKTYGFNKKRDIIALSQFALITHLGKDHICRNLALLAKMNLIIAHKGNRNGNTYQFNKDYSTWKPLPKKATLPIKAISIAHKGKASLPSMANTKDNYTKDTITKERGFTPPPLEEVINYCNERTNQVNPQQFIDFYTAKGWMVGKNKMKDWRACIRTWEQRDAPKKEMSDYERLKQKYSQYNKPNLG